MLRRPKKGRPVAVPARTHNPKIDVPLRSHTRGPQNRSPRLRAVCLVQSFKELLRPPKKGKADAKVRLFPVSLQTSGGLFSGKRPRDQNAAAPLPKAGAKVRLSRGTANKTGDFFHGEANFFCAGAGRQVVTGNARSGMGRGREGDTHLYNIYKAGEGRGKGMGARQVRGGSARG